MGESVGVGTPSVDTPVGGRVGGAVCTKNVVGTPVGGRVGEAVCTKNVVGTPVGWAVGTSKGPTRVGAVDGVDVGERVCADSAHVRYE